MRVMYPNMSLLHFVIGRDDTIQAYHHTSGKHLSSTTLPRFPPIQAHTFENSPLSLRHLLCSILTFIPFHIYHKPRSPIPDARTIKFPPLDILRIPPYISLKSCPPTPSSNSTADCPPGTDDDVYSSMDIWILSLGILCQISCLSRPAWILPDHQSLV